MCSNSYRGSAGQLFYLCTDEKKLTRLWERALKALANTNVKPERIDAIVDARDVEKLAKLVGELT